MSASSSKPWACPSSNAWASAREQHGPGCSSSSAPGMPSRPRTRYPEVELVIVTGNTSDIAKAVAENSLDVGVVTLPVRPRQLVVTPFYTDRLVAIAPRGWPWRTRRGGTIRQVIEGWFKRGRVTPRVAMELGNSEAIKELVCAGLGPSITSWASVRTEVREGKLRVIPLSPPLVRRLGIIKRRDKPENPALRTLLRALERRAGRR